jgi:hypothetical protein
MTSQKAIVFLLAALWLIVLSGCREVPTSAKVGNGPSFSLNGSGRLASFRVYGPLPGHKIATPFDGKSLVWAVQPSQGYLQGFQIERLEIRYGNIPNDYTQTVPTSGTAPALPAGKIYYFFAETTNAPPSEGFFYLDGNIPIEIKVPGLCQSGFVGDVKPLKCGTQEPYSEPQNLDQFVRENRLQM